MEKVSVLMVCTGNTCAGHQIILQINGLDGR